jgi:hypothetical protein
MSVLLKTSRKGEDCRAVWLRSSMRWMVAGPTFSGALESITNITFQQRECELRALDKEKIVTKEVTIC